ncbi:MAG: type IV toxin-antitoxin system AbiEi family antitoxin [Ottowia sp.]|uniref:type IV toxin-antitoxin system AbiEi family antitoxin domain-containing protein n=1 Tax=Ottowia sp. TaxID=1898956 RepID=UPI0039E35A02
MRTIQEKLAAWDRPIVSDYELGALVAAHLESLQDPPALPLYKKVVEGLSSFSLIFPDKDFKPGTVYHLFGRVKPKAMEVACSADPFAYVSHLSAMEYHGLTDRFSKILYLTTPTDKEWREQATARMNKDLKAQTAAYRAARLPMLRRLPFERVEGQRVELMRRSSRGAFKTIKSTAIRVATIGRVFLDMVREPHNCGGIQHVVDTYRAYAERNLALIVEEVERHGNAVEKVRAGYLLDEVCRLSHPLIDGWTKYAQRGGSRMLDPQAEYASHYSEKWMLSINVPSLMPGFAEDGL